MTIQDLINAGVASDAELMVQVFDWAPAVPMQVPYVVDGKTGSTAKITNPLLVVMAGPSAFKAYQNTGFSFSQQYIFG